MSSFFFNDVIDRNYDIITFISKYLDLKTTWSSRYCWHHQNYNHTYKKQYLKTKKKIIIQLRYYLLNAVFICIWRYKNCWFRVINWWCQQNSSVVSHDLYRFWISFYVRYNYVKIYFCSICVTDFGEGLSFYSPIADETRKGPSWIGLILRIFKDDSIYCLSHFQNSSVFIVIICL